MADFSADDFAGAEDSVEGLPTVKEKKKKKKKKPTEENATTGLTGTDSTSSTYTNDLLEGQEDEDDGPAGRAQQQSDFEKGVSVFSEEDMQKEHLENRNRLMIGKAIQVVAAIGIAFLVWGLWSAYVVATSTCHLHGGPDNNNAGDGNGDDPCLTGYAGYCLIGGFHSNAHNTRELCESCGCDGARQADVNNAIDQKDGTFQSYLFADDTGRVANTHSGDDPTKASGQSAFQATWACTCGSAKWIDGYCDCSVWEDCMLTVPVETKVFCETIDQSRENAGTLGSYGENSAVWTKDPDGEASCEGTPAHPETYDGGLNGCAYTFSHPRTCDDYGDCTPLPFEDRRDRCPVGCTYTPAPGTCSVPTWQRRVDSKEDCNALDPPHEWKDGHTDEGVWNNWLLVGIIVCVLDGAVLGFFWFGKGWQSAEAWGYIDIAL